MLKEEPKLSKYKWEEAGDNESLELLCNPGPGNGHLSQEGLTDSQHIPALGNNWGVT